MFQKLAQLQVGEIDMIMENGGVENSMLNFTLAAQLSPTPYLAPRVRYAARSFASGNCTSKLIR